ncbi:hypothetical protein TIFTF001_014231 [Ficus carica]|uniref:Uncharacterized protein n=1 Tax=Ficus carica TaxID=3494 RepID=A0AA88D7Z4_FICCA|nr:hypothetical protein TIFTF001_014231 [Ficus carica]
MAAVSVFEEDGFAADGLFSQGHSYTYATSSSSLTTSTSPPTQSESPPASPATSSSPSHASPSPWTLSPSPTWPPPCRHRHHPLQPPSRLLGLPRQSRQVPPRPPPLQSRLSLLLRPDLLCQQLRLQALRPRH